MASQAVHFTNKNAQTVDAEHHPPATHPDFTTGDSGAPASHDLTSPVDLNSTSATPKDVTIPGVLIAIPFPPAVKPKDNAKRPMFMLYAPPRAAYRRPPAGPDGKAGKEKLIKRIERGWQEEVAEGNAIKDGEVPDAGRWKRTKGALTRVRDVGRVLLAIIPLMPKLDCGQSHPVAAQLQYGGPRSCPAQEEDA
jgi:hypothetical protein